MAFGKKEITRWLTSLPGNAEIAVDEDGVMLIEVGGHASLRIGGEQITDEEKERFWKELIALEPEDGVFTRPPEKKKMSVLVGIKKGENPAEVVQANNDGFLNALLEEWLANDAFTLQKSPGLRNKYCGLPRGEKKARAAAAQAFVGP